MTVTSESPVDIFGEYADVFGAFRCVDKEYHIEVDPSITPTVAPPRRVPIALMDKYKAELERMENNGIIVRVSRRTHRLGKQCCDS